MKNDNDVEIKNENNQVVASGDVSNSGNTTGGSGTSGTVTNENGTTFNVVITNTNPEEPGICTATSTVPATPVEPTPKPNPNPPAGGEGEVMGEVTVLPNTQNTQPFSLLAITGAFVVIATTATAILVLIRRRLGL